MTLCRMLTVVAAVTVHTAMGDETMQMKVDRYRYMDPMFECVRIVLAQRGEAHSPAYIQGISGMAFRMAGPCPCAPTCSNAMEPKELIERLGYEAEEIKLGNVPKEKLDAAVADTVAKVKDEIRAGRAAIVWHAFTNAEFDVVSGFDDIEKAFIGYGSYKGNDKGPARGPETHLGTCGNICPVVGAILVKGKKGELDAREAELDALLEAIRHGRSPRDRFLAEVATGEIPWRFQNGLACYDAWIRQFALDPAQKVPDGAGNHYPLNVYASVRQAAPEFLRSIAAKYPRGQQELLAAAACFERDAAALHGVQELFGGWGPKRWKKPEPEKARATIALLKEAKGNYAEGIDHLSVALQSVDPERAAQSRAFGRVRRQNGKVWIRDVARLQFDRKRDNTLCGALHQAALKSEHPYSYSDLMGLSGLAFRFRYSNGRTKTGFCPSSAIGEMPDEQKDLARRTGWEMAFEWQEPKEDPDGIRSRIVAAIDAGNPVLCYPPVWNVGLIYGYEDEGRTLLVNDYLSDEFPSRVPLLKMGPMRQTLKTWTQPMPMEEALVETLAQAVKNWRREKHHGGLPGREYWYGKAALDAWIGDLVGYEALPEKDVAGLRGVDGWIYHSLWDARQAAVVFLKEWSLAAPTTQEALSKVIEIYQQEVELLQPLVAAKYDGGKRESYLSAEERKQQIGILRKASDLEERAIAAIEHLVVRTRQNRR